MAIAGKGRVFEVIHNMTQLETGRIRVLHAIPDVEDNEELELEDCVPRPSAAVSLAYMSPNEPESLAPVLLHKM